MILLPLRKYYSIFPARLGALGGGREIHLLPLSEGGKRGPMSRAAATGDNAEADWVRIQWSVSGR